MTITHRANLECKRGNPFRVNVYLRGIDGTGYHARFQVRVLAAEPQDGELMVELSDEDVEPAIVITASATDPFGIVGAKFECTFTGDDLLELSGQYNWVLHTTDADDKPRDASEGHFLVNPSTYKSSAP